jgi:NHL repeat
MKTVLGTIGALGLSALLAGCAGGSRGTLPSLAPTTAQLGRSPSGVRAERVCPYEGPRITRCFAWIRTDVARIGPHDTPGGITPADLQTAYSLTQYSAANGVGQTVAIVDAFDNPNAEADLAVYRAQWGLPPCTTANGCFRKQKFTSTTNAGWNLEESLDVDMVSAICPNCNILLVESPGSNQDQQTVGEKYALSFATYVSNSWGSNEGYTHDDPTYDVPGATIVASTGDSGYNSTAQWPAILPTVIAVGGTTLSSISPRVETAWGGAGSGCSTVYSKPSWQHGIATGCSKRAEADVSADADPSTGAAIYDSTPYKGTVGWRVVGGTSESSPIIAAVYALGGCSQHCTLTSNNATYLYQHASHLYDVTGGPSNGNCNGALCAPGHGWDGQTGFGSPNGLGAFSTPLVVISASRLLFNAAGSANAQDVAVSQDGYNGKFIEANDCNHTATVTATSNAGGNAKYSVKPEAFGTCDVTFAGANNAQLTRMHVAVERPGAIVISPEPLTLYGRLAKYGQTVAVSQSNYAGQFTETNTCRVATRGTIQNVATVKTILNGNGSASYTISPAKAGSCSVTFTGAAGTTAKLPVTVVIPGPVVITPSVMNFYELTSMQPQTFTVSQSGYLGAFSTPTYCAPFPNDPVEVTIEATSDANGNAVYKVTPYNPFGTCVETVTGGAGETANISITVAATTVPTPSPSPSAAPPSPSPSPSPLGSPSVFVADSGSGMVKALAPGCTSATCVSALGGGFSNPRGVAVDASGNVFEADYGNGTVNEIPPNCVTAACVVPLAGGFSAPWGVAVDGSDDVYISDNTADVVEEIPHGCAVPNCVVILASGFNGPSGVAVDANGDVFVADSGNAAVKEIASHCFNAGCITTLGGGFNDPVGLAIDGSGNIFVADYGNDTVDKMPSGCSTSGCVTTLASGFNGPEGVAVDSSGNVFVGDYRNNAVKEIPQGCVSSECTFAIGGGFSNPAGIAVAPATQMSKRKRGGSHRP